MAEKRASEVGVDERSALLKHDIERARNEIGDTVDAIETRLSPARIKEQISSVKQHALDQFHDAKEQVKTELKRDVEQAKTKVKDEIDGARYAVREATVGKVEHMVHRARNEVRDVGVSMTDRVRENPIPVALIGLGAAWLLMSSRSSGPRRFNRYERAYRFENDEYGERPGSYTGARSMGSRIAGAGEDVRNRAGDLASEARDKASHVVEDVRDKASHMVEDVRDKAAHVAGDVRFRASHAMEGARERAIHFADEGRMRARHVGERANHMWEENPLAIGAVAFAVGAAIGLALPTSRAEDRIFGQAKERLMNKAGDAAREALHMAEDKASQALHGSQQTEQGGGRSAENRPNNIV
jgi:ElaB/YqjD/DUF883 family membrane-anchored ribosome-binding protein